MDNMMNVKKTQIEMVRDRGYPISENEMWIIEDEMDKKYKKKFKKIELNQTYIKNDDILYVYYIGDDLKTSIKDFKGDMINHSQGILIGDDKQIKTLQSKVYTNFFNKFKLKKIQLFSHLDLVFNITTHNLNGVFEKIPRSLIIPRLCHADQLSCLLINDPIVRYYGYNAGDIIQITEDNDIDTVVNKTISYVIVKNVFVTEL